MSTWLEFDALHCAATPADPLPAQGRNSDLDDLDLDLLRRRESDTDDDEMHPEDDSDLELPDDEDSESIGLDTSTGFEDSPEDLELPEDGEDQRWSVDSEEAGELPGADADMFPGEEYGWIGDDEPSGVDDDFDNELSDDEDESRDDGGAEGLEDDSELDDLDLGELPDIDADLEEDAVAASGESLEDLAGLGLSDEPTVELAPGEHWKLLPARSRRVTELATLSQAPSALAVGANRVFVAAGSCFAIDLESGAREELSLALPGKLPFQPLPASATSISALAVVEHEGTLHVAAIVRGVVFVSSDGGRHFAVQELPEPAVQIGFTHTGPRPRLWWLSARGALRAVGAGATDAGPSGNVMANLGEVLAFHADGARHLVALVRRPEPPRSAGSDHREPPRSAGSDHREPPRSAGEHKAPPRGPAGHGDFRARLALSGDAGKRFSFHEPPAGALDLNTRLAVCRGALLVYNPSGVYSAQPPQAFERVSPLSHGPAVLANEDDAAFVYSCVHNASELSIVRRAVRTSLSAPMIIASLKLELASEPRQLAASYAEGGAVSLFLASDRTLLRVDASLDGEELA